MMVLIRLSSDFFFAAHHPNINAAIELLREGIVSYLFCDSEELEIWLYCLLYFKVLRCSMLCHLMRIRALGTCDMFRWFISGISVSYLSLYGRFYTPITFSIDGCYDAQYITSCPWEIQKWSEQFSVFFALIWLNEIEWRVAELWILVSGKVQVSLVWNSRNERSHNADKLQALSSVSFSYDSFLLIVLLVSFIYFSFAVPVEKGWTQLQVSPDPFCMG